MPMTEEERQQARENEMIFSRSVFDQRNSGWYTERAIVEYINRWTPLSPQPRRRNTMPKKMHPWVRAIRNAAWKASRCEECGTHRFGVHWHPKKLVVTDKQIKRLADITVLLLALGVMWGLGSGILSVTKLVKEENFNRAIMNHNEKMALVENGKRIELLVPVVYQSQYKIPYVNGTARPDSMLFRIAFPNGKATEWQTVR